MRKYPDPTMISLALIAAAVALLGYWWLWPDNPVKITNALAVAVDKEAYAPGDRVIITLDYCKTRKIVGKTSRSLVDGISISYAPIECNLLVGCRTILMYDLRIPEFTPAGVYRIEGTDVYPVNPLRSSVSEWRTVDFQVSVPSQAPLEILRDGIQNNTNDIKDHDRKNKAWQKKHSGACKPSCAVMA